ncbi:MAG: permease-like cell division protein FtsX [Bacteroidetes bacterium]|nr:permease-like cell division protein FtsX [Bacteroidota bacterium]
MAKKEDIVVGRRLKTSIVSAVVSVTLVLYVLGLLGLTILHARKLSDHVKENIGFSVIMHDNAKPAEISILQKYIDGMSGIKSTEFISKEKAASDLTRDLGEDFVAFLGYNPLFPSIEVRFNAAFTHPDSLSNFSEIIEKERIVKEVYYQRSLVEMVNDNVTKIGAVLLIFSGLLLVIAFALINNTIRLSVFSKRFLIKSMQLVGATQGFIRKPFVIKSISQGLIGSCVSIASLIATLYGAQKQIPELIEFQDINMLMSLFVIVILLGIIISWISTFFAVRKYLNIKSDNLYFY